MNLDVLEGWRRKRIFVLGDVMLDRFVYGRVERISPEAPIPVLHYQSEQTMLGGAANVARNIASLGGTALLVGVLGSDEIGDKVVAAAAASPGIEGLFVRTSKAPTSLKTRFVANGQQLMRLDIEDRLELDDALVDEIVGRFEMQAGAADALVLSDYAKGTLSPAVLQRVIAIAHAHHIPVVVDPKSHDVGRYAGASVITPNAAEAEAITREDCSSDEGSVRAARRIRDIANVGAVVLTRGPKGMTIEAPATHPNAAHLRTTATEVFDVSGAGDTVVAALSLALAGGLDVVEGARIANIAAGIAVSKHGTAAVRADEMAVALSLHQRGRSDPKVATAEQAAAMAALWRERGLRVGFTNGCFDLLHPGHIRLLRLARAQCDRLIVALNSDASVRRLKGEGRPVQAEDARLTVMSSMESVDLVTLFEEDTPLELIRMLKPDILIKGSDYTVETVVGSGLVQSYGGKVVLVPLVDGHSTTTLVSRAQQGVG